jgi:hypothetical protein
VSIQDPTPVISVNPASVATCELSSSLFSATASVASGILSHKWEVNTGTGWAAVADGGVYSTSNTPTLNLSSVPMSMDGYQYRYIATGSDGSCSATSAVAALDANPLPVITTQPANFAGCENGNTSVSIVASATGGVSYQWQEQIGAGAWTSLVNAGVYSGSTTPTLSFTAMPLAMSGYKYRCIVTSTIGNCLVTSNTVIVTVNPLPIVSVQPANFSGCEASSAAVSITASATGGVTYQWREDNGAGATNIVGATSSSYTKTALTNAMNGYNYSCVVTSVIGSCSVTSSNGTLSVNPLATITTQPSNTPVCESANAQLSVVATIASGTLSYQWQVNTGSGWSNLVNNAVYNNVNTAVLDITNASVSMNGYRYQCVITTSVGVCSINTTQVTLTVNAKPIIPSVTANGVAGKTGHYCVGGTVFVLGTSQNNATYQLQDFTASTNIGAVINGTGSSISFPAVINGQYKVLISDSTTGCTSMLQ